MIILDVPKVFQLAGGPNGMLAMLREACPEAMLNYPMVQMWRQRSSIPGVWIAPVLCVLTRRGGCLLEDLITTDDDPFGDAC